eukprot:TRINITY_DN2673_c0_g1_i6.p1 TRINITY_DN2673_c0_g1~~TRINITY_DN2673_c0_g1_i6.p1  ORF type:complete len:190 (-),score=33.03 TRINITY_DN2673_c0_g1_i6:69-638(-)
MENQCVCPGDVIANSQQYQSGAGTYVRNNCIHSALVGFVRVVVSTEVDLKPTLEVHRANEKPSVVPFPGDVVICKVTKVNPRFATVKIVCVGDVPLVNDFPAVIRQLEVRQTQIDEVEIYKCFRPGDVVRAEVISLGDKNSYYLSTAKNEYGVIFAQSVAGATMIPISWDLMQCPKTKITEHRKVAKID